uniref:Uncharacterized protein n=1 Tax=Strigamia maritima TaxID=126957 RepID=T1J3P9_STRMM
MQSDKLYSCPERNANPLITYAGDRALFKTFEDEIVRDLPAAPVEWRRSYGRPPKTVSAKANFVELEMEKLIDDNELTSLIGQKFLHTFWTDCCDVEMYKSKLKDDVAAWLTQLKSKNTKDWVIVVVEGADSRKGSKPKILTRGSVVDKMKNDFCKKQTDRCVIVTKSDNNDSWHGFLQRLRHLLLQAYNRQLSRFEENMRSQRERRNELGWNFCDYFLLQEELAFVYEMLGIYDEALVQYDELDALFTQFVINSNLGDTREWLLTFSGPCLCWEGLSLSPDVGDEKRLLIEQGKATLLDLRNYLFSRQCSLLLLLGRPWELAQRFLTFTYSCINELQFLEVEMPVGAVACWVFLSSLEVLQTCEKFKDSNQEEAYFYFTASLWATARLKLQELGTLCGLMPGKKTSSEQLHHVVELVAGLGVDRNYGRTDTPLAKLKEALSSDDAFQKQYLELSELAIGTLKHIGRIRYARLIGRDLADFYRKLGVAHNSIGYLLDDLKTFQDERWALLSAQTLIQLADCYSATSDWNKYPFSLCKVRICLKRNTVLSLDEREKHFDRVEEKINQLPENVEKLRLNMCEMFEIVNASIVADEDAALTIGSTIRVKLTLNSRFPKPISCDALTIAINEKKTIQTPVKFHRTSEIKRRFVEPLKFTEELMYLEDKSLERVAIVASVANTALVRQASNNVLPFEGEVVKRDFEQCVRALDVVFQPGTNEITLEGKCAVYGRFVLTQLIVQIGNLELVLPQIDERLTYEILFEPITLTRGSGDGELIAGIPQQIELCFYSGTSSIAQGTKIRMKTSSGLLIKLVDSEDEATSKLEFEVGALQSFDSCNMKLSVFCHFGPQKDASTIHSEIKVTCPWAESVIQLQFVPPFITLHKLHTLHAKKFIQVTVHSLNVEGFELKNPSLKSDNTQIAAVSLNIPDNTYIVRANQIVCFLWELVTNLVDHPILDLEFAIDYSCSSCNLNENLKYKHKFILQEYKTLFIVNYKVEPRNSEFCRAGNMCNMSIKIVRNTPSGWSAIMYEVLADQTSWAVCGHTAAVVNMESSVQYNVSIDVMPLTSGFLPLPVVRLSKFIPADKLPEGKDLPKRIDTSGGFSRLEPFNQGQVYNASLKLVVIEMSANNRMSLVAQFDDLCRFTSVLTEHSDDEFLKFVRNQEECRKRWLEAEFELERMISLRNNEISEKNALETKLKHCRNMLSQEMEKRKKVEQERENVERQLSLIKEILLDANVVNDKTREKLAFLSETFIPNRRNENSTRNLRTIDESADSILSPSDFDITEDDLDVPRTKRSRAKRSFDDRKKRPIFTIADGSDSIVATTTLSVPHGGPITASSRIETLPPKTGRNFGTPTTPTPETLPRTPFNYDEPSDESLVWMETGLTPRPFVHPSLRQVKKNRLSMGNLCKRPHDFVSKTVIKPEKCVTCDKRIKFGKLALRCKDCRMTCHVDCKEQSPLPCTPVSGTPGAKGLVGCVIGDFAPKVAPLIPALILHCVMEVESRGLTETGLYRIPGSEREVKELKAKFLGGKGIPKLSKIDIHAICGCIKDFLRSVKEPLVTYNLWHDFVKAAENVNEATRLKVMKELVEKLPQTNRDTLAYLIMHLQLVAKSPDCKMPALNLARVFGPTLVGYSSPETEPAQMLHETKQQAQVIECLMRISQDYWAEFINVHIDGVDLNSQTPESRPGYSSVFRSLTPSSSSRKMLSHTPLGPSEREMPPKQRKIAIMGFRSVGKKDAELRASERKSRKSSLTIQFVEGQFVDSYDPTIENTFNKTLKIKGQEYVLKLVDTAGQDEYSLLSSSYSMDIHGYVLVYSINSQKSFEVVRIIYDKLLDMTGKVNVPIVLVANKTDLHMERVVSYDEGKQVADTWKAAFMEASAKQNQSVQEIFHTILNQIEKADGNIPEQSKCLVS